VSTSSRLLAVAAVTGVALGALGPAPRARSAQTGLVANGTSLAVTTSHSVATFARADLVGFTNTLTGETYLRNASTGQLASVDTITNTGQSLQASNWTIAPDPGTGVPVATITLGDVSRTLVMTVRIDPVTDEIVIRTSATTSVAGLRAASWSVAGLDLEHGRLIAPAQSGRVFDAKDPGVGVSLDYPNMWNAQTVVYEAAAGSFVAYSTDPGMSFKRLRISTRGSTTIDVALGTEPVPPFPTATGVPEIEWRLKAFAGDWRAATQPFRTWLLATRPPLSTVAYPWVANIRSVITVSAPDSGLLAPLAAALVPAQTLLYLVDWRVDGYDVNYPDYTPRAGAASFVQAAHALGFKVMLHTDLIGVSPGNADYSGVQAFQVRTPESLQLMGWRWELPPSTPYRFAYISPASSAFRALWIARVGAAVAALQPDALHLDISSPQYNDGNGIIEGRTYPAGSVKLHDDIVAAFPTLALGGEGENDFAYRYHAFAQVLTYTEGAAPPGHPITAYLFSPSVRFYGHLGQPVATDASFKRHLRDTVTRGALPTARVYTTNEVDLAHPDHARLFGILQSWQTYNFQFAAGDWGSDLVRYAGSGGSTASLTDAAGVMSLVAAGTPLVRQAHDVNRVTTPALIRGWPAFDATTLYGLDPARLYWLDPVARPTTTHVTSLPDGVRLKSSTLVGNGFAHIAVAPVPRTSFDAMADLLYGQPGVRYLGVDGPLGNGAVVYASSIVAGGQSRSGLFIHPPWQGQIGGETFIEYAVAVPRAATLRFAVAVADNANCTDGVTFRVTANGAELWSQHLLRTGWQEVALGLAAYADQTLALRLISHPGPANNPNCDWSLWSGAHLEVAPATGTIAVPLAFGPGDLYSGFDGDGLLTVAPPSGAVVSNVPVPGRFTVFTAPGPAVSAGSTLTALPFQTWRAGRDELAQLGSIFDSGTIGSGTAGGVFKNPVINGHPPDNGRTVLSWVVRLPDAGPLRLGWSAGIRDGGATSDGIDFEVHINGVPYWRLTTSANQWFPGSLDLAGWQGRSILIELVTDSRTNAGYDWALWADLVFQAGGGCTYGVPGGTPVGAAGAAGLTFAVTAPAACPWSAAPSAPWLTVAAPASASGSATVTYSVAPNLGGPRSGTIAIGGQAFVVSQAAGSADLVANGSFDAGLAGWQTFATPDPTYIVTSVVGGVLEFYRQPPPPMTTNQATVFQQTGVPVPSGTALEARFDLGNSSAVRKRVSVLVLEFDFSDLFVCTFWLEPGAPLRTYRMRTHTTKAWTNAAIYFYAATAGANGGAYRLDNVSLHLDQGAAAGRTDCVDPTSPAATPGLDGPSLLANGDFNMGLAPWGLFGQIVQQVVGGVFEFYRPPGVPAGVVLQNTGQPMTPGQILTATFELGNSSGVRKRVTVLLHDNDFSDLMACTFWLPPGLPLSPFAVRGFATQAWTNATLSVYPATVGAESWIRLDNVTFQRTPSRAIVGTECVEPGDALAGATLLSAYAFGAGAGGSPPANGRMAARAMRLALRYARPGQP